MRNYELVKKIWSIVNMKSPSRAAKVTAIHDVIEKHRPEIAGKLPTHESLMEEMRKYPHQDNHMD